MVHSCDVWAILPTNVSSINGAKVQIVVTCELHFYCNNLGICGCCLDVSVGRSLWPALLLFYIGLNMFRTFFSFCLSSREYFNITNFANVSEETRRLATTRKPHTKKKHERYTSTRLHTHRHIYKTKIMVNGDTYLVKNILDSNINTC